MIANVKRIQKCLGANGIYRLRLALAFAVALGLAAWSRADAPSPSPSPTPELPASYHGLRDGESLTYSVRWGFIPSVGRIKITAEKVGTGPDAVLKVTTVTGTWGLARGLFKFDGRGESIYQLSTGRLVSASEVTAYGDRRVQNQVTFDYDARVATYTDFLHPKNSKRIKMPPGEPADLILALLATRNWNLPLGSSRDALVIFEDQFYPLTIRPEAEQELVLTSLGLFKATILVPRMEKNPAIGMFKRGSTVRVWIATEDARHLPVRFEVGFRFGTGTATIIDYQGPK